MPKFDSTKILNQLSHNMLTFFRPYSLLMNYSNESTPWEGFCWLIIRIFSVGNINDKDHDFLLIDFIKESIIAYSVSIVPGQLTF